VSEIVQAKGICRAFGQGNARRLAVDGVSLRIDAGEFVTVVGPSGSGKSTLLGVLGALDRGFEGELLLFGRNVREMSDGALARLRGDRIGFVFQAFHLLDHMTVLENVTVPFLFTRKVMSKQDVMVVLERVGLGDRAGDKAGGLSGGQRQRVAIARAMVLRPSLLLCDEPTGNLDAVTAAHVIDIFGSMHREDGVTVLCATHDERMGRVATRSVVMVGGRVGSGVDGVEVQQG